MIQMAAPPSRPQSRNSGAVSSPQASSSRSEEEMFSPTSAAALALSTLHHFGAERDNRRTSNLRGTRLFNNNSTSASTSPYYHPPTTSSPYHSYSHDVRYERQWHEPHPHQPPPHQPPPGAPWHPPPSYASRYHHHHHHHHPPPPPPPPPLLSSQDSSYSQESHHSVSKPPPHNVVRTPPTTSRNYHPEKAHRAVLIPQENGYHSHLRSSPTNFQGPSPLVSRNNTFDGSSPGNPSPEESKKKNAHRPPPTSLVTPTPKKAKIEKPTAAEQAAAASMIKTPSGYSRKKKSLGILAENFLRSYETLQVGATIVVDEAANKLGVERRRIYDVVNILESICLVCKKQKNTYTWMGMEKLDAVFGRLQAQAIVEYPEDAEERLGSCEQRCNLPPVPLKPPRRQSKTRENKSLAKLSQEFLQVFLVGYEVLSLPEASDKIQGTTSTEELIAMGMANNNDTKQDPKELKAAAARGLKTKIRRLYDIANVFLSVGLLKKVESNDSSRRPNFAWSYRLSAKDLYNLHHSLKDESPKTPESPSRENKEK